MFVHRSFKNRDILVQRNINTYMGLLCFKAAGLAEFRVVCTGHAMFGEREECVCVQPVAGTNLWIDKRLLVHTYTHTASGNITASSNGEEEEEEGTSSDANRSRSCDDCDDDDGNSYTESTEEGRGRGMGIGEEVGVACENNDEEEECMEEEKEGCVVMDEQDDRGLYCCVPEVVHSERWTSGVGCQMCLADDSGDEGKCK